MLQRQQITLIDKDSQEVQFRLLCTYGDIVSSKATIVVNESKDCYSLYSVLSPFPTIEEYLLGVEFEEGELLTTHSSFEKAHNAQLLRKT